MTAAARAARLAAGLLALWLAEAAALAQGTTSTLGGTVTSGGTPLPGATITIASDGLQGIRATTSNANGDYYFHAPPPGEYRVTFSMTGLREVQRAARVGLATSRRVDAALEPVELSEELTVSAERRVVSDSPTLETNLDSGLIDELPVSRTLQGAIDLAPSVTTSAEGLITIAGGYTYDSLFLINGGVANENLRGQPDSLNIEDAIQDIAVLTGAISAEYGRFTGGVVSVVTKSGGNSFSGSFRTSLRNPAWTSASDFGEAPPASETDVTYEATFGGRVVRDRLWFFAAARLIETTPELYFTDSDEAIAATETDRRYEIKLTQQLTRNQNLVASYLSYDLAQEPHCPAGCWEVSAQDVDGREVPRELVTVSYNGIIASDTLLEGGWAKRELAFVDSGGTHLTSDYADARDIALGTSADVSGGRWGAPVFCEPCGPESRDNEAFNLKASWYRSTRRTGTHNVVAGYERFAESRHGNAFVSGSNFALYSYSGIDPTRTGPASSSDSLRPVVSRGDFLYYFPVDELSGGSDFVTESLFLNDKWDVGARWSFNLGIRYDRNDGTDGLGQTISDDDKFSPRLNAVWDALGDGRVRVSASFGRYASRIQESVGGLDGGGNASTYSYAYDGPAIGGPDSGMASFDVLEQLFAWLLAQGWTPDNRAAVASFQGAYLPGVNFRLDGSLRSPHVDEITLGLGLQPHPATFVRLDLIRKEWSDFYVGSTTPGDVAEEAGRTIDVVTIENCADCLEREYRALQLQGSYEPVARLRLGGNYTWSELRGDTTGEANLSAQWDNVFWYPEYHAFEQHSPVGLLPNDSTHKLRLWISYDVATGGLGSLSASLLQRFDSGRPYSASTTLNTRSYVACHPCSYALPATVHRYFLSERGEYRWDDVSATDLALNFGTPLSRATIFVQAELLNAFNEQAVVSGGTGVRRLKNWNPFTETPVEGVHWAKAANFGQPTGPGSYQMPRTWRVSFGARF